MRLYKTYRLLFFALTFWAVPQVAQLKPVVSHIYTPFYWQTKNTKPIGH